VVAVHMVGPLRPEETVAGERPHGWSPGCCPQLHTRSAACP
jgi:hypothetical protein